MTFRLSQKGLLVGTVLFLFSTLVLKSFAATDVTICHATDSVTNPYTQLVVDANAADGNTGNDNGLGDHSTHTGPVPSSQAEAQTLKDAHTAWGDIIPPHDGYAGLNWTAAGQAIYNNGCNYVTTTPSPTTSPTVTTSPAVTTTPTTTISPTITTTVSPTLTITPTTITSTTPTTSPTTSLTPTVTPSTTPTTTPTPGTQLGGNTCFITNQITNTSNTGFNSVIGNTGGSTLISTGNATTITTITNVCNINIAVIHFPTTFTNTFTISGNAAGSINTINFNSFKLIRIFQ